MMAQEIEFKEIQAQPVARIRTWAEPHEMNSILLEVFKEINFFLAVNSLIPAGAPYVRYYSFSPNCVDFEAGLPVFAPIKGKGRVTAGTLPAGQALSALHAGPFETLEAAYNALKSWSKKHDIEPAGDLRQVYTIDPVQAPDPRAWRTELLLPIKAAS